MGTTPTEQGESIQRDTVNTRTLGRGLTVSAVGLGCMGMSEIYGSVDEREAITTIHRALELGVTLLDTAHMYGVGRNDELVGRATEGNREEVVLAAKFGNVRGSDGAYLSVKGRSEHVRSACPERSRVTADSVVLGNRHRGFESPLRHLQMG